MIKEIYLSEIEEIRRKQKTLTRVKMDLKERYVVSNCRYSIGDKTDKGIIDEVIVTKDGDILYEIVGGKFFKDSELSPPKKRYTVINNFSGSLEVSNLVCRDNLDGNLWKVNKATIKFREDRLEFPVTLIYKSNNGVTCVTSFKCVTFEVDFTEDFLPSEIEEIK